MSLVPMLRFRVSKILLLLLPVPWGQDTGHGEPQVPPVLT